MLGGSSLRGRIAPQRLSAFSRSSRSISSFRPPISGFPARYGRTLGGNTAWRPPVASTAGVAARFNSTSATTTPDPSATPTNSSDFSDLSNLDLSDIPEKIGYLKELGLDYGWGPSSVVQFVLEHIHMYTGLPWWGTIVATGLLFRFAMLPSFIGAANTGTKIANLTPISGPIRAEMSRHASSGDHMAMLKAKTELQKLHDAHDIKAWKAFTPMLIQVPIGFASYRVVKGMAHLPVPGLAAENFAWISDLTISDPYFILPAVTSLFMYLSIKRGGEFGNSSNVTMPQVQKMVMYALPSLSFIFTSFFPGALQIYFATTSLFGLGQSYLINSPAFRKWAGIALPQKYNTPNPLTPSPSEQSRALRMLTEALEEENARRVEAQKAQGGNTKDLSWIDRSIQSLVESKNKFQTEATEKLQEMSGKAPAKNADGTPAEPPRLNEKDRKLAEGYEKRRKEEEEWKRDERNHARREAYLAALEREREKARAAFKNGKVKQR